MYSMNTLIKLAAGDQEFEQAFFQLAYDKIQAKLYNLLPFMVGFQLVKRSNDSTKAVGVFGFKSNNGQIIFVPAFFINGKIKDMDIMYSRNNNQFYPLTEEFAELFLKDDITGVGTPSDERKEQITKSIGQPNMRDVIWPPRTGRVTYASVKEDTEEHADVFNAAEGELLSAKTASAAPPDLIQFVKEGDEKIKGAFLGLLEKHSHFTDAVRGFYSDSDIADALRIEKVAAKVKEPKVKVIEFEDTKEAKKLTTEHKHKVVKDGYVIVDSRPDEDKSDVGLFKFTETFGNPVKSGFYPYVTEMGTIRHGLVLMSPQKLVQGFNSNKAIVVDLESSRKGQCYTTPSSKLFVKDTIEIKNLGDALKVLEEPAESLPSYDDYILINENLACSEPFTVIENYKDGSGVRRIKVAPTWRHDDSRGICCTPCGRDGDNNAILVLTKRPGDKLEFRNNSIYVPKGFKLLKVHLDTYYSPSIDWSQPEADRKKRQSEIDEEKQRIKMGKPGGLYCLNGLLREKNTFPLTVHTNGSQYFLNVGGAKVKFENPVEAKIAMVAEVGLAEKDAEEILRDLIPNQKREGYVKLAVTGDHTLSLQDEEPMSNEFGQPTYYGVPWVDSHDRSDGYTGDPTQMGMGVMPDQGQGRDEGSVDQTVDSAVNMAQNGQKEVFDTQAIAALSRYTDTSTKVIEYIPNFVTSLDKLGRMLFLAYWDTEKFEKMYGKDELPELIELVKNVFTNLGDLIIFLKRKVPDISINNNEQSMEQI